MIVTVHQPEYLPWMGFFDKMSRADLMVLLDTVQYRKNYFQNRNRILGPNGPLWLTVPVETAGYMNRTLADMRINNAVRITNRVDWRRIHWKTVGTSYGRHPFFKTYGGLIEDIYASEWEMLTSLNAALIETMRTALGVSTPTVWASALNATGAKTDLMLDICRKTGATTYLSGPTGREYLDGQRFAQAEIEVLYHRYDHPIYSQRRRPEFVSHLSVLDLLMNSGPASLDLLRSGGGQES